MASDGATAQPANEAAIIENTTRTQTIFSIRQRYIMFVSKYRQTLDAHASQASPSCNSCQLSTTSRFEGCRSSSANSAAGRAAPNSVPAVPTAASQGYVAMATIRMQELESFLSSQKRACHSSLARPGSIGMWYCRCPPPALNGLALDAQTRCLVSRFDIGCGTAQTGRL